MGIKVKGWTLDGSGLNVQVSPADENNGTMISQDSDNVLVSEDNLDDLITVLTEVRDGLHG